MYLPRWLVRSSFCAALVFVSALGGGWKWEHLPF
jgi:hypothetical protein